MVDCVMLGRDGVMNLVRLCRNSMMNWLRLVRNMMWLMMHLVGLVRLCREGVVTNMSELSSCISFIPGLGLVTAHKEGQH